LRGKWLSIRVHIVVFISKIIQLTRILIHVVWVLVKDDLIPILINIDKVGMLLVAARSIDLVSIDVDVLIAISLIDGPTVGTMTCSHLLTLLDTSNV
jgi:hypothetical protein